VETKRPAGKVSVNPIPVSVTGLPAGLLIVKARVLAPLRGIKDGVKALEIVGVLGFATVRVALLLVAPVPPLVDETTPVVLLYVLRTLEVTLTLTVQELLAATVPPVRATIKDPAVAVAVPPHVLVRLLGVATTRFTGKSSVKATPCSATVALGLVIVIVSVEMPFERIEVGLKALAILGGATTVMVAVAGRPVPPSFEVMAVVELFFTPAEVPVTLIDSPQWPDAAKLTPEKVITLLEAEMVPPQVAKLKSGVVRPAGSVSVSPTPVSAVELGLDISKASVVVPFRGIDETPKVLDTVGGEVANAGLVDPAMTTVAMICAKNAQLNIRLIIDLQARPHKLAVRPAA
jgi:hypothetical protein